MMLKKKQTPQQQKAQNEEEHLKTFLDMNLPGMIHFYPQYIVQDGIYRCIWAVRSYPTNTFDQALFAKLGETAGVTIHVISKQLTSVEEGKIIANATNRSTMVMHNSTDAKENVGAQEDVQDVLAMIRKMHRDKESLVHTNVFIEISSEDFEKFNALQMEVASNLKYLKINVDQLFLRQEQGFLSVIPGGTDQFKGEFSRALPEKSVANLFPYSYSGKTDAKGFMVGKDKNGSYIIVDINKKDNTHTNSNCLILGNAGQGKSYLLKGLIVNMLESGQNVMILDPEHEYEDLVHALGGNYLDLMDGTYKINVLEPKIFTTADDDTSVNDSSVMTKTFTSKGIMSQHISFLKDFFGQYKSLNRAQLDVLEILITRMYEAHGITNETDVSRIKKEDFPIMTDLWNYSKNLYDNYDDKKELFSKEALRDVLLALESICQGSQARYFDGHTNIKESKLLAFGMKGALDADTSLRNAMLFNVLSYMSDKMLNQGHTAAILDEFYLFLSSQISVEYCRNIMKRCRKKESSLIIASQNIEDFLRPDIESYTKPLFSIPVHKFLFNPGSIDVDQFTKILNLEPSEYRVIQYPQRGLCLYVCGNERYSLMVHFPEFKTKLFGTAGGN